MKPKPFSLRLVVSYNIQGDDMLFFFCDPLFKTIISITKHQNIDFGKWV